MFEGKKMAAYFSGLKAGLHIHEPYLNVYQPSFISLKKGGSGISRDLSYTGSLKTRSSAPLLNRGFFAPQLRSIVYSMAQGLTGMREVRKAPDCLLAVRHPHLLGGLVILKPEGVI